MVRQQTTQIGPKNISKKKSSIIRCPTRIGPRTLTIPYLYNGISNSSDKLKFYLFANDTNLLYADKNLKSLESTVNAKSFRVYNWLIANKLSLNIMKSNFVIFRPRQKKLNHQVNLKVFDHHNNWYISLERKNCQISRCAYWWKSFLEILYRQHGFKNK